MSSGVPGEKNESTTTIAAGTAARAMEVRMPGASATGPAAQANTGPLTITTSATVENSSPATNCFEKLPGEKQIEHQESGYAGGDEACRYNAPLRDGVRRHGK